MIRTIKDKKKILILIGGLILLILVLVLWFSLTTKDEKIYTSEDIKTILTNGEDAIVYVENSDSKKCSKCKEIKKYLDKNKVDYILYDINKNSEEDYNSLLQSLSINYKDFGIPAVVYIKDGNIYSNIINVKDIDIVENFIDKINAEK